MDVSRRTFRRIAAALMLSSSLTFASVALTGRAAAANELETFFSSAYTYCDAKLVASLWSIPIDEAKATIGRKILNGIGDAVPVILQEARLAYACEWADTPHTYSDAEKLAALWGLPDPYDAKLKVAKLYTQGRSAEVVAALGQGMPALWQPAGAGEAAAFTAFADSPYTYCDAKLVAGLWSISIEQAKVEIGQKIINGYGENIPGLLAAARESNACGWEDTGHSYEDAVTLAGIWGLKDPYDAKLKVAQYYTNGESAIVLAALAPR